MRFLLTGGSACGKSTYGEKMMSSLPGPHYYLATMHPIGPEGIARVERHRRQRQGKNFITIERYTDISGISLPQKGTLLLECLCNLTANEMFDLNGAGKDTTEAVLHGIQKLEAQCHHLIVVTNEVGCDGESYDSNTLQYIHTLGQINCRLAARFEQVYELCCGTPAPLKGTLWPVSSAPY